MKYNIELMEEEMESLINGKEIELFDDEDKDIQIYIRKPKVVLTEDYFLDDIREQIGSDRYDGKYSTEYWDMDDVRDNIIDTTLSLKVGDLVVL